MQRLGLDDIDVALSDRAYALLPPYADAASQAELADEAAAVRRDAWIWGRDETRRYYLAGGGDDAAFAPLWDAALARRRRWVQRCATGHGARAGGALLYLTCGTKPGAQRPTPGPAPRGATARPNPGGVRRRGRPPRRPIDVVPSATQIEAARAGLDEDVRVNARRCAPRASAYATSPVWTASTSAPRRSSRHRRPAG